MRNLDDTPCSETPAWWQEGPQAILRALADAPDVEVADESLWLALNAWA